MYRFLLTRRWLGLLVATVLVAAGCVALGRWQLARLEERHQRNALLARNLTLPPRPPGELLSVGRDLAEEEQYARVRATGRYDPARQLLVRIRPFEGEVGYDVLTPFVTDEGPALLVNRGWVPAGATSTERPAVPAPPQGTVTVIARARPSEPTSTTGTPPPGQVSRIDVPGIAATMPYDVYGGYGELVRERPAPARAPAPRPAPEPSEGPHLAYAFQWFLFAVLALGGFVVLARRESEEGPLADRVPEQAGVIRTVRG